MIKFNSKLLIIILGLLLSAPNLFSQDSGDDYYLQMSPYTKDNNILVICQNEIPRDSIGGIILGFNVKGYSINDREVTVLLGTKYRWRYLIFYKNDKGFWREVFGAHLPSFRPRSFDVRPHQYERFYMEGKDKVYKVSMDKDGNDLDTISIDVQEHIPILVIRDPQDEIEHQQLLQEYRDYLQSRDE